MRLTDNDFKSILDTIEVSSVLPNVTPQARPFGRCLEEIVGYVNLPRAVAPGVAG